MLECVTFSFTTFALVLTFPDGMGTFISLLAQEKERGPSLFFFHIDHQVTNTKFVRLFNDKFCQGGSTPARNMQHVHSVIAESRKHENLKLDDGFVKIGEFLILWLA